MGEVRKGSVGARSTPHTAQWGHVLSHPHTRGRSFSDASVWGQSVLGWALEAKMPLKLVSPCKSIN